VARSSRARGHLFVEHALHQECQHFALARAQSVRTRDGGAAPPVSLLCLRSLRSRRGGGESRRARSWWSKWLDRKSTAPASWPLRSPRDVAVPGDEMMGTGLFVWAARLQAARSDQATGPSRTRQPGTSGRSCREKSCAEATSERAVDPDRRAPWWSSGFDGSSSTDIDEESLSEHPRFWHSKALRSSRTCAAATETSTGDGVPPGAHLGAPGERATRGGIDRVRQRGLS